MKFSKQSLSVLLALGAFTFSGCSLKQMIKLSKQQQLTVTPSPLEVHADTVSTEVSALLPVKMLKKNKIYTVKTWYQAADQKVELGEVEFKQNPDFPNAKTEQPKLSKKFVFPYTDNLKKGDLNIQGTAYNFTKSKFKSTEVMPIAKGMITTSKLVKDVYFTAFADHGYNNKEELEPTNVGFFFEKGKSELRKTEIKSKNGTFFEAFVAKKNVTRVVTITGSHSPEGTETINTKLSDDRAKSISAFYKETMKKFKYNQGTVDSIQFVLKAVVKDWTSFKDSLLADKKLTQAEKDEVLAIINGGSGDFIEKEKQLQKLKSYKYISKAIYPNLRTAKTEILTVKPKKTDAQISILAKGVSEGSLKVDTLSNEELLYAATLTPDPTEKEKIYTAASRKADTWQAYNNLGAIYVEMAKKQLNANDKLAYADKAVVQLELANKKEENALSLVNLGTAYAIKGDWSKAVVALDKAYSLSKDESIKKGSNSVKSVYYIKRAKYDEAIAALQNGVSEDPMVKYNLALSYLLKKDFEKAKVSFDEATTADANNAWAFYGGAITAARQNNIEILAARLQKAIKLDDSLRAKALEDLEFLNFWNNEAFKNAIK